VIKISRFVAPPDRDQILDTRRGGAFEANPPAAG
jgi:hypothetical protein